MLYITGRAAMTPELESMMANDGNNKSKLHYLVLTIMLAGFCAVAVTAPKADPEPLEHRLEL